MEAVLTKGQAHELDTECGFLVCRGLKTFLGRCRGNGRLMLKLGGIDGVLQGGVGAGGGIDNE